MEVSAKDVWMFLDHWCAYCHSLNIEPYSQQELQHDTAKEITDFSAKAYTGYHGHSHQVHPLSPLSWTRIHEKPTEQPLVTPQQRTQQSEQMSTGSARHGVSPKSD